MKRAADTITAYPKLTCALAGALTSLAFLSHPVVPALCLLGILMIVLNGETSPRRGALYSFLYAMAFFVCGLYWVQNALAITMGDMWYLRIVSLFGLPLLLAPFWVLAGYLTVRLTRPGTLARGILFATLVTMAEYGRAWLFTGFPWNLFAYAWADVGPIIQVSAFGGVFLLNALTILWALTPAMLYLGWSHTKFTRRFAAVIILTLTFSFAYGIARLQGNPTQLRQDAAIVVVQPNIAQKDKWDADKIVPNFQKHVDLSLAGLKVAAQSLPASVKSLSILWPETSIDEGLIVSRPDIAQSVLNLLDTDAPYKLYLTSGLMRREENHFRNSIVTLSTTGGTLRVEGLYDKIHLVPFGEYMPLLDALGLPPVTGFEGFTAGPSSQPLLSAADVPPAIGAVCFEVIFPWSLHSDGAEWIVNTSNDGWYGNTTGPRQHLAITRFRAVEQGVPVLRSTTTGISAAIDSYGRILQKIDFGEEGFIVTLMPQTARSMPMYRTIHEAAFMAFVLAGLILSAVFHRRKL